MHHPHLSLTNSSYSHDPHTLEFPSILFSPASTNQVDI